MNRRQKQKRKELSPKQKRFCAEYIKNHANAAKAYALAGYSETGANGNAAKLRARPEVQEYIRELVEAQEQADVADADEVLRYLTKVMRGEHESSMLVTVGTGSGKTKAVSVTKKPEEKEQLEAAKTLAKIHGLLTNKVELNGGMCVQIVDDIPDEGGDLTGEHPNFDMAGEGDA